MVSSLSPQNFGKPDQVDLVGSYLGGQRMAQGNQLQQQAIKQNEQQISRADYEQGVQRLTVINRLAKKVKELSPDQRFKFVQSINPEMLQSVGIDPKQISSVQLDDNSLDALIAQTGAAMPEDYRQTRVQSTTRFKNGAVQQILSNGSIRVLDPSGKEVSGQEAQRIIDEANNYEIDNSARKAGDSSDARNQSDLDYAGRIKAAEKGGELDVTIEKGGAAKEAEALGAGRGKNIADTEGAAVQADKISGNLLDNISEARKLIPNATGSYAGALRDAGGRAIGVTSEASKNAAKLETLAGWMVANVPRMEGPQSNIDVENYRTMAGRVGDRTLPNEERLAALDILETLQKKYSAKNKAAMGGSGKGSATPGINGATTKTVNWSDLP